MVLTRRDRFRIKRRIDNARKLFFWAEEFPMIFNPFQIQAIIAFIYTIPIFAAFGLMIRHYKLYKSRHSLFFTLAWFSYMHGLVA
ncbi:MAG: hypothetical protein RBG13Loki_3290 [Promethearchaeota archaeon CR_4]|nr:MAG: hypothetical protein RBG13Loki_3290 [Candidatus Lokiarchaeota archaeon CR_4]